MKHVGPIDLRLAAMEEAAAKSHNALMRVEQEAVDQETRLVTPHNQHKAKQSNAMQSLLSVRGTHCRHATVAWHAPNHS